MELREIVNEKPELTVLQLQEGTKILLDYTPASLAGIEEILSEISEHIDEIPKDQIEIFIQLMGSYILDVASREFQGEFFWLDDRNQPIFVVGEPDFHIAIITFDKVRGRINSDEADHIPFF